MNSVKDTHDCYGCGVCAMICKKQAVTIKLSHKGFYAPYVDSALCNGCGLCIGICAFAHKEVIQVKNMVQRGYGAWSKDSKVRYMCSSGGLGYELARYLLSEGYDVCAVKYDSASQRAIHYIATNETELLPSVGSKYIQSYTVDAFKNLIKTKRYLITGTPCQIDSFRRYIRKYGLEDNYVLMDFFCHGLPSMYAWRKYLKIVEKEIGHVTHASWRNKFSGWHDSWAMNMEGLHGCYNSRFSGGDIFYKLFLGDYCCSPACQKDCKYKYDKSSADIRIGDFWGKTYRTDDDGVSAVVAFTEKGDAIVKKLNCTLVEYPFEVVAEGQMKKNAGKHIFAPWVSVWLLSERTDTFVIRMIFVMDWIIRLPRRVLSKLKRVLQR